MNRYSLAVAPALLLTPSLHPAFEGPYAPELWTFTTEAGGFIDKHTADTLLLVGGNMGDDGDTDVVIPVIAEGTWSFHWTFVGDDTAGFDHGYYLINGSAHYLAGSKWGFLFEGSEIVSVNAGDVIGFRVDTVDGIFGPGFLTITDFSAPVPEPAVAALLITLIGLPRRRRCYDSGDAQW